ncbi:MAG: hypothetical protein ACW98D_18070, partial [Promethearchaeota archaeon]
MAKFIMDSADLNDLKKWAPYVVGMTTNPILLGRADTTAQEVYDNLVNLGYDDSFTLFIQKVRDEELITEQESNGRGGVFPKVVYKIPLVPEQYSYIKELKSERFNVCGTMTYDLMQFQMAVNFGVDYSIVLCHKNIISGFVWDIISLRDSVAPNVKLIGASFRTKQEVIDVISAGVDYVTVPPKVLNLCFDNEQARKD